MIALPQNLAAVNWTFGQPFNAISFLLNIPSLPLDSNGNQSEKGIYFQLYDQRINNTGTYFGLQTNIMRQVVGGHIPTRQFGAIFSRWETRDNTRLRVAEGGFPENADHEGDFIGIRRPIDFIPGKYKVELKSGKMEQDGVWYDLTIEHAEMGEIDCGGLKFPLVNGVDIGFQDGGGTWIEIFRTVEYPYEIQENDLPTWKVTIEEVKVTGGIPPVRASLTYPFTANNGLSYVQHSVDASAAFNIGSAIERDNRSGLLF